MTDNGIGFGTAPTVTIGVPLGATAADRAVSYTHLTLPTSG